MIFCISSKDWITALIIKYRDLSFYTIVSNNNFLMSNEEYFDFDVDKLKPIDYIHVKFTK